MPHRVLVVDDQLLQREHLRGLLELAGASLVETAESGAEALDMLDHQRFDLVLSDLVMPGIDGVQFIQKLSLRATRPALAVVSSSPRRLIEGARLVAETLGMHVVDHISKPATLKAISGLLARMPASVDSLSRGVPTEVTYAQEALAEALTTRQVQAWHQPKVRLTDGLVVASEALVRWVKPDGSVLLPGQFLPSIVASALEEELLIAVVEQAIEAQSFWAAKGHRIEVSINLPSHLLDDQALPDRLHAHVIKLGGSPESLCFELTEDSTTRVLGDFYAGICRLRMKGFGLAQDDSGQGYSSLFNIASTPFTEIKIDRSLVSRCAREDGARAAVESIVSLGRKLGLNVVAEGVETREQLAVLRDVKCSAVQGFLVSRALTQKLFGDFVLKRNSVAP